MVVGGGGEEEEEGRGKSGEGFDRPLINSDSTLCKRSEGADFSDQQVLRVLSTRLLDFFQAAGEIPISLKESRRGRWSRSLLSLLATMSASTDTPISQTRTRWTTQSLFLGRIETPMSA